MMEIPVHGEEADVETRARVVEENDVDKIAEPHSEHVTDTIRREEVDIEEEELLGDLGDERTRQQRWTMDALPHSGRE